MRTADIFRSGLSRFVRLGPKSFRVLTPDGVLKYAGEFTSGVYPRDEQLNGYDQKRRQFTHDGTLGTPAKYDILEFTERGVAKRAAIEEVRSQPVGSDIPMWRIVVGGDH